LLKVSKGYKYGDWRYACHAAGEDRSSDDHSLTRGRGKGTVSQNMHGMQVKQIVIAAGETTEKVCKVTPRTRHLRGHTPR